jgi:DNA-binding winged helix-turn-helix (wHTH) protein/Tol biopolymer transport system component
MNLGKPRPAQGRHEYRFGDFVLDVELGFLHYRGEEVPLQPKAFEVLSYLVEQHGRIVNKDELINAVWQETAVTDNSLSQCMVQVRRALADDSQQVIRTVARRGYVFAAPLTTPVREFPKVVEPQSGQSQAPIPGRGPGSRSLFWAAGVVMGLVLAALLFFVLSSRKNPQPVYTQITNFVDSAAGPVLSPDGKMLAFFRGDSAFATPGPIYVKMLPNGEAVQIANDPRNKYGLAFSRDSSQIAYTVWDNNAKYQWNTYSVPVLGGEPKLLFANAAGLTWLDDGHLLYSEVRSGLHMGVVTSNSNRTQRREIYFPEHERRMAHYSYLSPDGKWILVPEMEPSWLPCRIVPFDGSSAGRQVGPPGPCTSAGWSPDGKWMYFAAEVDGAHHLWRQRFPDGKPEQITFGPAEEEDIAVAPDGRSLITSVALRESAVRIHDSHGEYTVSPEGYAPANYLLLTAPVFSQDGRYLYYLLSRRSDGSANEIWRTNLDTKTSEGIVRGFSILEFDISEEAGEVVFSSQTSGQQSQIWLAPLDRSVPPRRLAESGEGSPHFGPNNKVWFRYSDGKTNYAGQMNKDGSGRRQVTARPISTVMSSSPGGRWLVVMAPGSDTAGIDTIAIPASGDGSRLIGRGRVPLTWAPDGRFVCIGVEENAGQSAVVSVPRGELPELPAEGIRSLKEAAAIPGARRIDGFDISLGSDPFTFAYVKTSIHKNLFRISWP